MCDKEPGLANHMDYLVETFQGCKILCLYRDLYSVASSFNVRAGRLRDAWPEENDYRAALRYWENGNKNVLKFAKSEMADQLFVVRYEQFFSGDENYLNALYQFLQLPITETVRDAFESSAAVWQKIQEKPLQLTPEMREFLAANRDLAIVDAFDELFPRL